MIEHSERAENRRLLAVDDDPLIIALYQRLFSEEGEEGENASRYVRELEGLTGLMGGAPEKVESESSAKTSSGRLPYELTCCSQGLEAVAAIRDSIQSESPYAVALVDMRMPPGIDGLETAKQIRQIDPNVQLIFVTAYSDHTTDKISDEVGGQMLFFHKPLHAK